MTDAVAPVASTASRNGIEYRQAQMRGAAFARGDAADHLRTVSDGLFRVECALATGETLADNLGVFIN